MSRTRVFAWLSPGLSLGLIVSCGRSHGPSRDGGVHDAEQPSVSDAEEADAPYALIERADNACGRHVVPAGLRVRDNALPCVPDWPFPCTGLIECRHHADCAQLPKGSCQAFLSRYCSYPDAGVAARWEPCEEDDACRAGAGGSCESAIVSTSCVYDGCNDEHECASGQRCACNFYTLECLDAECASDEDCGPGRECLLSTPCDETRSYHCSTNRDECRTSDDCHTSTAPDCGFRDGRFHCLGSCPEL
jgi:hypothetical protein